MKSEKSIQGKMLFITLFPVGILGTLIVALGTILLYRSYSQNLQEELESTTNVLLDSLDLTVSGDYTFHDHMLFKGDLNITGTRMMNRVKERSDIDTTIFWQDTRVITTIKNEMGSSAVGTDASPDIVHAVLENGENYYSDHLTIYGMTYIGYYMPLENSDHTIVGMVFAGKKKDLVYRQIFAIVIWFIMLAAAAVVGSILLVSLFSRKMVSDINVINKFLKTIADGNLSVTLDPKLAEREDELGTIGQYASKMQEDLKSLIERDPLTSLYNRRTANNLLNALEEEKIKYSVVMCDIDWFKKVNDNYGHAAGDYVLVTVSGLIRENVADCGFGIRWGGEEFLLIYKLDADETKTKVEQLQKRIREHEFIHEEKRIKMTMTFGLELDEYDKPYEERINKADKRLYIGKNNGRDQIVS